MTNNHARKAIAGALVGVAATIGLTQAPSAFATTAKPVPVSVEICGEGAAVTQPDSMILTCADNGEKAEQLVWTSWTSTSATATGLVAWRTHAAIWHAAAAQFTLSDVVIQPNGSRLFTKLTLNTTGVTPAGFMRNLTFDEAPTPTAPATTMHAAVPAAPRTSANPAPRIQNSASAASGTLGYAEIEGYWIAAGGSSSSAETAAAITGAESSFYPGIIQQQVDYCGPGSDRAGWGLWQITCGNSVPAYGTDFQLLDPWNNAEAAVDKYNADVAAGFNGFDPWSTYTSGAYVNYLDNVAPATGLTDPGEYVQNGSTPSGTPSSPAASPGSTYGPPISGSPSGSPIGIVYDNSLSTAGSWSGAKVSDGGGHVAKTAILGLPNGKMDLFTLANGDVWINTLSNGTWSGASVIDTNGSITALAAAALPNGTVHLDTVAQGKDYDDIQNSNGSWAGATLVDANGAITDVALAALPNGTLHLETLARGAVWDDTPNGSGGWTGATLVDANGAITSIALTVTNGTLALATVAQGKVWVNTTNSSGAWTGATLVDANGAITDVAVTNLPNQTLHLETLARGAVWDDTPNGSGGWTGATLVDGNGAIFNISAASLADGTMHLETIVP